MKRQNVRTLSLVVCTFTYLLVGAAVFDALESENEDKRLQITQEMRSKLLRRYNISDDEYKLIEMVILESKPHKAGPQWKFSGAFYFAIVVVAVIGYGHSTPATISGKAFCIAYAVIGIPLGIFMFQSIGERLNKLISIIIRKFKTLCKLKKTEATEMDLMTVTGFISSLILMTGAAVFSRCEGWSYLDSFYYCFITLTTIGFGDLVALQNDRALSNRPGYAAFSMVFILFGLAVMAGCMNLLVLRFMTMNAEDVKRDDGDGSSRCGRLSLDGEFSNLTNGFTNIKLATIDTKTSDGVEFDQVSVCSCTDCSCFGYNSMLFGGADSSQLRAGEKKMAGVGQGQARPWRKSNGGRWATQIHVHDAKSWRNWRRPSSTSSRRSGSRLSRLTFGIDSIWNGGDSAAAAASRPPAAQPALPNSHSRDVYSNFQGEYTYNSRVKRASI